MSSVAVEITNEKGSVLVAAVLFMIILTLIGTMAMNTSTVEQQIAANDKFQKIVFQNADSGIYAAPKVISQCYDAGSENVSPVPGGVFVLDAGNNWVPMGSGDGSFYREMMGYDAYDASADLRMVLDGNTVNVDIQEMGNAVLLAGGGVEFASGAEGVGSGSAGGGSSARLFREISTGFGEAGSVCTVNAVYRKILGVPGGL